MSWNYYLRTTLGSGIIQGAIDQAVQAESEKLASEALRDGTKVSERLRQGGVKLQLQCV